MTHEKELLIFQPITGTTIEAHEVCHYTTVRKTLGIKMHNISGSKHICIQDCKAFQIKHVLQALKLQ
jgi:hypothetical protein